MTLLSLSLHLHSLTKSFRGALAKLEMLLNSQPIPQAAATFAQAPNIDAGVKKAGLAALHLLMHERADFDPRKRQAAQLAAILSLAAPLGPWAASLSLQKIEDDGQGVRLIFRGKKSCRPIVEACMNRTDLWNAAMRRPILGYELLTSSKPFVHNEPIALLAARHLQVQFEIFMGRAAVLQTPDIETVHEMRVALRRFRAAVRVFGKFAPSIPDDLLARLKETGRLLGAVRDGDVLLAFLNDYASSAAIDLPFFERIEARRREAFGGLIEWMESPDLTGDMERVNAIVQQPRPIKTSVGRAGPARLEKEMKRVRGYRGRILFDSAENVHRLRIQCKRLRYAAEFLGEVHPRRTAQIVKGAMRLQDLLGQAHDLSVYDGLVGDFLQNTKTGKAQRASLTALRGHMERCRMNNLAEAQTVFQSFRRLLTQSL